MPGCEPCVQMRYFARGMFPMCSQDFQRWSVMVSINTAPESIVILTRSHLQYINVKTFHDVHPPKKICLNISDTDRCSNRFSSSLLWNVLELALEHHHALSIWGVLGSLLRLSTLVPRFCGRISSKKRPATHQKKALERNRISMEFPEKSETLAFWRLWSFKFLMNSGQNWK